MKKMVLAVLAVTLVAGCSRPNLTVTNFGAASTEGIRGKYASEMVKELGAERVPEEYRSLQLSAPTFEGEGYFVVMSFRGYQYYAERKSLGRYRPAGLEDLLAFQRTYGNTPEGRKLLYLCAPMRKFVPGVDGAWMFGVSGEGKRYGLFRSPNSCNKALLVRDVDS